MRNSLQRSLEWYYNLFSFFELILPKRQFFKIELR
jgi:hypothetical protein